MKSLKKIYGKLVSATWKNFKLKYYLCNYLSLYIPKCIYQKKLKKEIEEVHKYDAEYIKQRVDYYNKKELPFVLEKGKELAEFSYQKRCKNYFFDIYQTSKYFSDKLRISYEFGDVVEVPTEPTVVKSRPISGENANSVLLKLNKVRHFTFVNDKRKFKDKKFKLLWRGNVLPHQKNRQLLIEEYYNHSLCDVGHINNIENFNYENSEKLTLYEHLGSQFILSLEGNDVATNLKWIMSSNSIAVMPKPKYETWFMEGKLIPDYHYILVKDDFSDMIEKITHYHQNPIAAEAIIRNANQYVKQFQNKKREKLISLLVLKKYFDLQN